MIKFLKNFETKKKFYYKESVIILNKHKKYNKISKKFKIMGIGKGVYS